MVSEEYIIPTLTSERQKFLKGLIESCSDPSLFNDIDFNIAYNNRLKWINEIRDQHTEKDEKQKLNWFYNRIDAEVHYFNLFMGYMRDKNDPYYNRNFPHARKSEEWKEFFRVLHYLEPFLPVNLDLNSFISFAAPDIVYHGYKGTYPDEKERVVNEYELYFQNFILPALIHLWKEALEIYEYRPSAITNDLRNNMIKQERLKEDGIRIATNLDDVIEFLVDKVDLSSSDIIISNFKQKNGKPYKESTVDEVIRRVRNDP